ncbi:hypothetical protein [Saccharopolyspora taberi]|uniref:Uncharacterized protein n=1 Tax=Saccharopolyspora taberi TaxID=60895 RepID=A0ABN3VAM6_9PSEU
MAEVPWLDGDGDGARGIWFDVGESGTLRDLAVATGRTAFATGAVEATRRSLAAFTGLPEPSRIRLMLTTRLADALLCAREPDQAVAAAGGAVPRAAGAKWFTVSAELGMLRTRLAIWNGQRDVAAVRRRWVGELR